MIVVLEEKEERGKGEKEVEFEKKWGSGRWDPKEVPGVL